MEWSDESYSSTAESARILDLLLSLVDDVALPPEARAKRADVEFSAARDRPYLLTPFKQTEAAAALKAVEACLVSLLADLAESPPPPPPPPPRRIVIDHEQTTAFLFQAYLARVGGLGKLDDGVRALLKGQSSRAWRRAEREAAR